MKRFFDRLMKPKIQTPRPELYPTRNNIADWMDRKVAYYESEEPENLHLLFNPSSGDYLPLGVIVGVSEEKFHQREILDHYREFKKRHPEAAAKAKLEFQEYMYYRGGDPNDYP